MTTKPEIVKMEVTPKELDDIANGLGLLAASLKRAENAERAVDARLRDRPAHREPLQRHPPHRGRVAVPGAPAHAAEGLDQGGVEADA